MNDCYRSLKLVRHMGLDSTIGSAFQTSSEFCDKEMQKTALMNFYSSNKNFKKGSTVFHFGDFANEFFFILKGSVSV